MILEAIEHITHSSYAHAIDEKTIILRLRAKKGDIRECILFYGDRACPVDPVIMESLPMEKAASDKLFDYFEVKLQCGYTRVCYYFWLSDGFRSIYYSGYDFYDKLECHRSQYFQFPYLRREDIADIPEWAKRAVIYQIFPDSFATSKRYISCKSSCLRNSGGEACESINGGTLRGIIENLDYLVEMGINCLYLNPIFSAGRYHKYDTINYFEIDPNFGDNETFKELVAQCHRNGISVVLDGVFNHSGSGFFAFKDAVLNGVNSRFKDWFYRLDFPVKTQGKPNYECFAYESHMPKLNTGNQEAADYFCEVGKFWIREADIDGWRLDVANEVDHDFWRQFRKAVRSVKPDAFLIAEIWEDSQAWLMGDQFDSTMNYRFTHICREFFAEGKISMEDFDARINAMNMRYMKNMTLGQMNLLDSHDVPRFLYWCGEDLRKLKLAALFQFTFVGIPSICYGDERAVTGYKESEYRSPMPWADNDTTVNLGSYYKRLIDIRKKYIHILTGEFKTFLTDSENGIYAFSREKGSESLIVVLNNCELPRKVNLRVPAGDAHICKDVLNDLEYLIKGPEAVIDLQPISGAVLTFR
jgi:glycosidase